MNNKSIRANGMIIRGNRDYKGWTQTARHDAKVKRHKEKIKRKEQLEKNIEEGCFGGMRWSRLYEEKHKYCVMNKKTLRVKETFATKEEAEAYINNMQEPYNTWYKVSELFNI